MNILSFDIEEWYLETSLHGGRPHKMAEFDSTLDAVLEKMAEVGATGTFFCLGKMASDYPAVIRKIISAGHDVGCHSNNHKWLTKMTPEELRRDTSDAIHALEDVAGQKVNSFRAPAFSITPNTIWAIEVLSECGIEIDASIFPAARDFGGYPSFPQDTPCQVSHNGVVLKEYPVTIMSMAGKRIAFSGGGYFRLLPYAIMNKEMKRRNSSYNICYFHLADLIPEQKKMMSKVEYEDYFNESGTLKNRLVRYIKNNISTGNSFEKLKRLLTDESFVSIKEANKLVNWDETAIIIL